MRPHFVLGFYFETARIDKSELRAAPLGVGVNSVARNARRILDYGYPLPDYSVEKGRFSDVWSSYYRNEWFGHLLPRNNI